MSQANRSIISHFIPLDFQVQFICKVIITFIQHWHSQFLFTLRLWHPQLFLSVLSRYAYDRNQTASIPHGRPTGDGCREAATTCAPARWRPPHVLTRGRAHSKCDRGARASRGGHRSSESICCSNANRQQTKDKPVIANNKIKII